MRDFFCFSFRLFFVRVMITSTVSRLAVKGNIFTPCLFKPGILTVKQIKKFYWKALVSPLRTVKRTTERQTGVESQR